MGSSSVISIIQTLVIKELLKTVFERKNIMFFLKSELNMDFDYTVP